ncbi:MAG: acyltransferase [Imperialibacter sp.]|uniref:acyltransferase family protein n=1 Tax=Imperialibacter sp. TaxID=2038411 RepID=UPI0032EBC8EC
MSKDANQPQGHLYSLDFLRGIAALCVVLFHFTNGNSSYLQDDNPVKIIGGFGHLGVQVFFVISGFIIPYAMHLKGYSLSDFPRFLWKRSLRIEPPYLATAILCILLGLLSTLSPYYHGDPYPLDASLAMNLLSHIGYLTSFLGFGWLNPVFWTLAIEFQYYVLIGFLYSFLVSKNKVIQLGTILLTLCSFFLIQDNRLVFNHLPIFLFGILLFLERYAYLSRWEFGLLFVLVLVVDFGFLDPQQVVAGLFAFVFIRFTKPSFGKKWLFLGAISYSLYLLHVPIGARMLNLSVNFIGNEYLRMLAILITIFVVIGASYFFYLMIEKPFMRISKNVKYND